MRFFIIVIAMSLSTLASGSTAIAQKEQPAPAQPTEDQAAAEKQNPSWYREKLAASAVPRTCALLSFSRKSSCERFPHRPQEFRCIVNVAALDKAFG